MIEKTRCTLLKECQEEPCGPDVYMMPGYLEEDMNFDNIVKFGHWTYKHHDTYACFPPYDKCHHDVNCIADDVRKEIKKVSGDEKVSIVGMCYGGNVAQAYASKWPEEVDRIALVMTTDFNKADRRIATAMGWHGGDFDIVRNTDFDSIRKNISAKVFEYNCKIDELFGDPPRVEGSSGVNAWYCIHWIPPPYVFDRIQEFLDDPSI